VEVRGDRIVNAKSRDADRDEARLISRLHELIDALDRRVPHLERDGETTIARDAAALKEKALERIAELTK
jgi:hypothetical protein